MSAWYCTRWGILAVLLLVSTGCGTQGNPPPKSVTAELGAEFTLSAGSAAHLDDDRLVVLLHEVSEDSRCPADVECYWEGDATVVATVTAANVESHHELHSNRRFTTAVTVDGYLIELKAVHPSASTRDIPADAYRVDLVATRT